MATLIEQDERFYLQFYDPNRKPKRRKVAVGTGDKRAATDRQRKLEYDYLTGTFDPWTMDAFSYDKQDRVQEAVTIGQAHDLFIARKQRDGRKNDTLRTYSEVVGLLMREVGENTLLTTLTGAQIDAFVRADGLEPATHRKRYSQLRIFIRWCLSEELLKANPLAKVTIPDAGEKLPKVLSEEELDRICQALRKDYAEKLPRNYARRGQLLWLIPLFRFAFYTGMRISEVGRLRWGHIDFGKRLIDIHRQKNKKAQTIPLNKKAAEILSTVVRGGAEDYVFRSPQQTSTNRSIVRFRENVSRQFTHYRKQAGIERRVTFHGLRHSFCTRIAEAGKSAVVVKEAARHSSIQTSMIYVHLANEHLKAELDDVFG